MPASLSPSFRADEGFLLEKKTILCFEKNVKRVALII